MATTTANKEVRADARKILHCPVKVLLKDGTVLKGRSLDLAPASMSVMLNDAFDGPPQCVLSFEAVGLGRHSGGKLISVTVAAEATYSICVGTSGFRVGFKFDRSNEAAAKSVLQLLD